MGAGVNLFLSEPWLQVMVSSGVVSRARALQVADEWIHVGEYQARGLKKWIVFGSFDHNPDSKLLELFGQARRHGVFKVESDFNMSRWQNRDFLASQAVITQPFGTYRVDLSQSEEALWQGLDARHRNMTRRARQEGVEIRFELDWELFLTLLDQTYARGDREAGFSLEYLTALGTRLGDRLLVAGAWCQGELQAALVVPFDARCGYFLHGASRTQGVPGSSNLLHWEVMGRLKQHGVVCYDLGGAREETQDARLAGIFRFKKRFGGPFIHCYYWEKVISPMKHWLHGVLS